MLNAILRVVNLTADWRKRREELWAPHPPEYRKQLSLITTSFRSGAQAN